MSERERERERARKEEKEKKLNDLGCKLLVREEIRESI